MTYDPTAAYRSAQVTTSSPAAQIVRLYQGAIRFAGKAILRLEARDLEGAHLASLRAQAIVSALRESLDLSAGDVAVRLDALYDFIHARLVAGNLAKAPEPTREAIGLLRELLEAWQAIAAPQAPAPAEWMSPTPALARAIPSYRGAFAGVARA